MIKIENSSLFGFESFVSDNLVLINVMVDPEVVELKNYRRTPFASIVINSETLPDKIKKINESENDNVKKQKFFDAINKIISKSKVTLYNSFVDNVYDKYRCIFKDENLHTIILYVEDDINAEEDDKTILIGGYPVQGMINSINKSADYNLLNGAFISTKMFTMRCQYPYHYPPNDHYASYNSFIAYDKLLCVYVDIKTKFEFREYTQTSDTIGIGLDNIFTVTMEDDELYPSIKYKKELRRIPIKGREYLFKKPDKNMFHLSDVPKDIIMRKHQLSRIL